MGVVIGFSRGGRIRRAVLAGLMVAGAVLFGLARPASASSTLDVIAPGPGAVVHGTVGTTELSLLAQLIKVQVDGHEAFAYCIDIGTLLPIPTNGYAEGTWRSTHIEDVALLGKITWILQHHPGSATAAAGDNIEAAAVQSAIWHFSDGFELNQTTTDPAKANDPAIVTLYNSLVANATDVPRPAPALAFVPSYQAGTPGEYLDFTLTSTTTDPVTLAVVSGSAEVATCDAAHTPLTTLTGPFPAHVCVRRETAGPTVVVRATTTTSVLAGRVFLKDGAQQLILADDVPTTVTDDAISTWHRAGTGDTAPTVTLECPSPYVIGQVATWHAVGDDADLRDPLTYHWVVDGHEKRHGPTGSTFRLLAAAGQTVGVFVTDAAGLASATVTPTCTPLEPAPAPRVTLVCPSTYVAGSPATWTATATDADGAPLTGATFAWFLNGASIDGQTTSTLTLTAADHQIVGVSVISPTGSTSGKPTVVTCGSPTIVTTTTTALATTTTTTVASTTTTVASTTTTGAVVLGTSVSNLPKTGFSPLRFVIFALYLVAMGGLLVGLGRRGGLRLRGGHWG